MTLASESKGTNIVEGLVISETGLPGVLFSMLDTEVDNKLIKDIHDTLTSMLQILAADNLAQWLSLCKDVLTVATGNVNSYCSIDFSIINFTNKLINFLLQNRAHPRNSRLSEVQKTRRQTTSMLTPKVMTIKPSFTLKNQRSNVQR